MKSIVFTPSLMAFYLMFLTSANAQSYRYELSSTAYQELTNTKTISFYQMDQLNGFYRLDELKGETFKWYNTLFKIDSIKTFHIQPYANLRFDNDSALIIVDGGFTYLDSIDQNSSISYKIEGQPGDLIVKTQWKNLKVRVGQSSNFMNVQIWVYQRSGIFEIRYGASSANNRSGFAVNNGPQVGIFFSMDDFSQCFEKLWVNGSPSNMTLDSNNNYNFKAMSGIPESGVMMRFIPRFRTLSLLHIESNGLHKVYPNPVKDGILHFPLIGNYSLYNSIGRLVKTTNNENSMVLKDFAPGIYYLRGPLTVEKIIIE